MENQRPDFIEILRILLIHRRKDLSASSKKLLAELSVIPLTSELGLFDISKKQVQSEQVLYCYCLQKSVRDLLITEYQALPISERYNLTIIGESLVKLAMNKEYFKKFEERYFQKYLLLIKTDINSGKIPSFEYLFLNFAILFERSDVIRERLENELFSLLAGSLRYSLLKITTTESLSYKAHQKLNAIVNLLKIKIEKKEFRPFTQEISILFQIKLVSDSDRIDIEDFLNRITDTFKPFLIEDISINKGEPENIFIRDRDSNKWLIKYRSHELPRKKHKIGYTYIQHLLRNQKKNISVDNLERLESIESGIQNDNPEYLEAVAIKSKCKDKILDKKAITEYKKCIKKLSQDIKDAEEGDEYFRSDELRDKKGELESYLRKNLKLSGRPRDFDPYSENKRTRVSNAITRAEDSLLPDDADLHRHFIDSIHKGFDPCYDPPFEICWDTTDGSV